MYAGFRWGFDLINVNSVHSLSQTLISPDVAIFADEEDAKPAQFFWTSHHLDELDDEAEAMGRALSLKALFDGALLLQHGLGYRPEPLGELWDFDRPNRAGRPDPAAGMQPFAPSACRRPLDRMEATRVSERLLEGSIYTARTDAEVFGMLLALGTNGINFPALYALTDTMETHGMSEADQWSAAGSSKSEWKLFTGTANNYAALGPDARHGDKGWHLKQAPMGLERASELVLKAANAFVSRRIRRATATLGVPRRAAVKPAAREAVPAPPTVAPDSVTVPESAASNRLGARTILGMGAMALGIVGALALVRKATRGR